MGVPSLRERFHDWCSAIIVERLSVMSSDEVYRRSRPPESEPWPGETAESAESSVQDVAMDLLAGIPSRGGEADGHFHRLIVSLLQDAPLPPFKEWAEAYARDPEPYDEVIVGFRDAQETETHGAVGT